MVGDMGAAHPRDSIVTPLLRCTCVCSSGASSRSACQKHSLLGWELQRCCQSSSAEHFLKGCPSKPPHSYLVCEPGQLLFTPPATRDGCRSGIRLQGSAWKTHHSRSPWTRHSAARAGRASVGVCCHQTCVWSLLRPLHVLCVPHRSFSCAFSQPGLL